MNDINANSKNPKPQTKNVLRRSLWLLAISSIPTGIALFAGGVGLEKENEAWSEWLFKCGAVVFMIGIPLLLILLLIRKDRLAKITSSETGAWLQQMRDQQSRMHAENATQENDVLTAPATSIGISPSTQVAGYNCPNCKSAQQQQANSPLNFDDGRKVLQCSTCGSIWTTGRNATVSWLLVLLGLVFFVIMVAMIITVLCQKPAEETYGGITFRKEPNYGISILQIIIKLGLPTILPLSIGMRGMKSSQSTILVKGQLAR